MAIPRNLANIAPHVNASSTELVVNDGGADLNFRVEGDTDANLLFVDAGADSIGIGTSSPTGGKLHITHGNQFGIYTSGQYNFQAKFESTDSEAGIVIEDSNSTNDGNRIGVIGDNMAFTTANTERARITSGGYFKASNSGAYNGSTSTYHEFRQTANDVAVVVTATDSNYSESGSGIFGISSTRSANSAFTIAGWYSGAFGDREFQFRGDGNGYADGTWNNNGADYAEFFESVNGQALTLGATVVLDGNKVREATDQDPASSVIGVVRPKEPSKASMIVGNTAWNKWANKYLTDDFDRYIMEDHDVVEWTDEEGKQHSYESQSIPAGITVPADAIRKTHDENGVKFQHYKLNPAWNPDSEYVNRENRPEWNIIGLLGQVKILKGQPVGDRWIKMRDVSATVEEWMIR